MLGYLVVKAKEDMYIKEREGVFIFKKDNIYVAKFEYNEVKIYDERDNSIRYTYIGSCFSSRKHYNIDFNYIDKREAINGREFYRIRKELRESTFL